MASKGKTVEVEEEKVDLILKEVQALRAEVRTLKMNMLQMNALKAGGATRV